MTEPQRATLLHRLCQLMGHNHHPSTLPYVQGYCRRCGETLPADQQAARPYPMPYARRVPGYPNLWEDTQ